MNPDSLLYTAEHEWVSGSVEPGSTVRVGITDFAQNALGDIVYVNLPEVDTVVSGGGVMGELESTKSVSDLFAPVDGTVSAVNEALTDTPELCNSDPYGDGWLVELTVGDASGVDSLLSSADYDATVTSQ
ncbi:MAG: glycine cleavage system protein GcvH [Nocardioidaceae bacterium]